MGTRDIIKYTVVTRIKAHAPICEKMRFLYISRRKKIHLQEHARKFTSDIFCFIIVKSCSFCLTRKMGNGRKSYTLDFKLLRVIERLHELGDNVSATARAMKVARRVVDRCRNREVDIRLLLRGRKKAWKHSPKKTPSVQARTSAV